MDTIHISGVRDVKAQLTLMSKSLSLCKSVTRYSLTTVLGFQEGDQGEVS